MKECGKASSAQSTSSSWGSQQFSVWTALHHESFFCLVLAIPSIVDALLLAINTSGFITWAPITWLFTFLPESGWNKEQDQARPPDHQAAVWCVCASVMLPEHSRRPADLPNWELRRRGMPSSWPICSVRRWANSLLPPSSYSHLRPISQQQCNHHNGHLKLLQQRSKFARKEVTPRVSPDNNIQQWRKIHEENFVFRRDRPFCFYCLLQLSFETLQHLVFQAREVQQLG